MGATSRAAAHLWGAAQPSHFTPPLPNGKGLVRETLWGGSMMLAALGDGGCRKAVFWRQTFSLPRDEMH